MSTLCSFISLRSAASRSVVFTLSMASWKLLAWAAAAAVANRRVDKVQLTPFSVTDRCRWIISVRLRRKKGGRSVMRLGG
jgi:hypothetical protein